MVCVSHFIANALDSNLQVDVIYTDFAKVFDRIDHGVLQKLGCYGISDLLMILLKSYLCKRICYVSIMGYHSSRLQMNSGVPQDSNLGPLLFILCINDVLELFSVRALLFADDLKSFSTVNELYDSRDLDRLFGWSLKNNLELNIS